MDGDADLIISGRTSPEARSIEVWLVENEGSPRSLALGAPKPLQVEGETIAASQREIYPFAADWNGDGKLDRGKMQIRPL